MLITEIENKKIKIGKTSITCIGDNGKTCGIVRNITKFTNLQPNKQIDYFHKISKCGIWGSRIDGLLDCFIIVDNEPYYLNDLRSIKFYEEKLLGHEGWEGEEKHYNERKQIAEKTKDFATVIDCYVKH